MKYSFEMDSEPVKEKFECSTCGKSVKTRRGIIKHLKNSNCTKNKNCEYENRTKVHQCPLCSRRFSSSSGLVYHKKQIHAGGSQKALDSPVFKCMSCKKQFNSHTALNNHCRLKHNSSAVLQSNEKTLKCIFCPAEFGSYKTRLCHLKKYHETEYLSRIAASQQSKLFDCIYCQKSFTRKTYRKTHEIACALKNYNVNVTPENPDCVEPHIFSTNDSTLHLNPDHSEDTAFITKSCIQPNVMVIPVNPDCLIETDIIPAGNANHCSNSNHFDTSPQPNPVLNDLFLEGSKPSLGRFLRDRRSFMNLNSPDVATPCRAKENLRYGQETVEKYAKKVRNLQQQIRRLKQQNASLKGIIYCLDKHEEIPCNVTDSVIVSFPPFSDVQ